MASSANESLDAAEKARFRVMSSTKDVTGKAWHQSMIGQLWGATASSSRYTWKPGEGIKHDGGYWTNSFAADVKSGGWQLFYIPKASGPMLTRWTGGNGTPSSSAAVRTGISPSNSGAGIHPVEHVLGQHLVKKSGSQYTSVSTNPNGAPGFKGDLVWVDVSKMKGNEALYYSDIVAASDHFLSQNRLLRARFNMWKKAQLGKLQEGEALIEGNIPPGAVLTKGQMHLQTGLNVAGKGLMIYAVAVDSNAFWFSENKSRESARIAGGWTGAWAYGKVGAAGGALLFGKGAVVLGQLGPQIGTPEEIITVPTASMIGGFGGGLIFGSIGYFQGSKAGANYYDMVQENLNKK